MYWINMDEKYADYLRKIESRIPHTNYGESRYKPFFGVLFTVGDMGYVTQVSHPKDRHIKLKQQLDFYKLYDNNRLIAVVNLNYMFPIPLHLINPLKKSQIDNVVQFSSDASKSKYLDLLDKELNIINSMGLDEKAQKLYRLKCDNPMHHISQRCLDFLSLEEYGHKFTESR